MLRLVPPIQRDGYRNVRYNSIFWINCRLSVDIVMLLCLLCFFLPKSNKGWTKINTDEPVQDNLFEGEGIVRDHQEGF